MIEERRRRTIHLDDTIRKKFVPYRRLVDARQAERQQQRAGQKNKRHGCVETQHNSREGNKHSRNYCDAAKTKGNPKQVMEELARRHLIRPITTQGHIGDVLHDKIVYDAQTTSGGSGGPLFNNEGKVSGINFAMVRDFGGSNFAIPISYGRSLLLRGQR